MMESNDNMNEPEFTLGRGLIGLGESNPHPTEESLPASDSDASVTESEGGEHD